MKKLAAAACVLALARLSFGDDSARLLSIDHDNGTKEGTLRLGY